MYAPILFDLSTTQENNGEKPRSNIDKSVKKRKPRRKALLSTNAVNDLVDVVVTCDEHYQRKLIFRNTKDNII